MDDQEPNTDKKGAQTGTQSLRAYTMNNTGKPLSFTQELALEKYLYTLQELFTNPEQKDNPEVMETLDKVSQEVSQFMTEQELDDLENRLLAKTTPIPPETLTIGELQLPPGWRAEDYEITEAETVIHSKRGYIEFSCFITRKDDDEEDD